MSEFLNRTQKFRPIEVWSFSNEKQLTSYPNVIITAQSVLYFSNQLKSVEICIWCDISLLAVRWFCGIYECCFNNSLKMSKFFLSIKQSILYLIRVDSPWRIEDMLWWWPHEYFFHSMNYRIWNWRHFRKYRKSMRDFSSVSDKTTAV